MFEAGGSSQNPYPHHHDRLDLVESSLPPSSRDGYWQHPSQHAALVSRHPLHFHICLFVSIIFSLARSWRVPPLSRGGHASPHRRHSRVPTRHSHRRPSVAGRGHSSSTRRHLSGGATTHGGTAAVCLCLSGRRHWKVKQAEERTAGCYERIAAPGSCMYTLSLAGTRRIS